MELGELIDISDAPINSAEFGSVGILFLLDTRGLVDECNAVGRCEVGEDDEGGGAVAFFV